MNFMEPATVTDLGNIRNALIRMEDTILFNLIERAQFRINQEIYIPHAFEKLDGTFLDWILLRTEKVHSKVRRYEAPDENAFFPDKLESPILPPIEWPHVLAGYQKEVNYNSKIMEYYTKYVVTKIGLPGNGETQNYGSCALTDVECLQSISRRIHFGKFVSEAKFLQERELFTKLILAKDVKGIENAITKPEVELQVLERVRAKAGTYGMDPRMDPTLKFSESAKGKIDPESVVAIYRDCIIPLTKEVEIDYLLRRLDVE